LKEIKELMEAEGPHYYNYARSFPGRSYNQIKSQYHNQMRKRNPTKSAAVPELVEISRRTCALKEFESLFELFYEFEM